MSEASFFSMAPSLLTAYLTRFFESPSFVVHHYTDNQIAEAALFIFGAGSGYISDLQRSAVSPELQVRCVRSIATLYTDLFDRVCGFHGTDPDSDFLETIEIDGAVYMMWDMGHLEGLLAFPEKHPHLVEPAIEVLESVLRRCRTSACRVSALHGIGHVYLLHNDQGNKAIAARMRAMVDAFLDRDDDRDDLPDWLREYAELARDGRVL